MLVIVEYRNIKLFLQTCLNLEAFRGSDIFQVNAAEARSNVFHCLDDLLGVCRIETDRERINAAELFKEDCLSFHDRHSSFRSDISKT